MHVCLAVRKGPMGACIRSHRYSCVLYWAFCWLLRFLVCT